MTQINNQGVANTGGQSSDAVGKGAANVDQEDADAFAQQVGGSEAGDAVAENPELEEFKDLFRRTSFKQFMEVSKELMNEAKKNTE